MIDTSLKTIKLEEGIDLHVNKTNKFKTNMIGIFLSSPLQPTTVSYNAVVPAVLRRGTKSYPTMTDISKRLEDMYGAMFDCGVAKKGETHIIKFFIECVNDKYVNDNVFEKSIELLKDIIYNPLLENNIFVDTYVQQEKDKVKNIILTRTNDKVSYALEKTLEIMCKEENYGIFEYGTIEALGGINAQNLYNAYLNALNTYKIDIFVFGDVNTSYVEEKFRNSFRFKPRKVSLKTSILHKKQEVKDVTEEMDVSQGKLSLGFRTNIEPNSDDYYALMVYNGILGGGPHSKLFQNVREKESLAYYSFSRLEKFKGLMGISSGIEVENYDKALDIIKQQVNDMKKGNISKTEFDTTIKTLVNGINSIKDEQSQMLDYYMGSSLLQSNDSLDDLIQKLNKVKLDDVTKVAQNIDLDTIYFIKSK